MQCVSPYCMQRWPHFNCKCKLEVCKGVRLRGRHWGRARTGDLQPTRGEVKRHSHLSIGRYHQHSVDVLDESMRVLDFFMHTCAPLPRQAPALPPRCSTT